jgi:hypothetical protein
LNENLLPDCTLKQVKNKVEKLCEMYLQKKKKANSTGEGNVNRMSLVFTNGRNFGIK